MVKACTCMLFWSLLLIVLRVDLLECFECHPISRFSTKKTIRLDTANRLTKGYSSDGIDIVNGPFNASQLEGYWGQRPLLIRSAFSKDTREKYWPIWSDMIRLAQWAAVKGDDDQIESGESARLITHIPGDLESFDVEFGPFEPRYLRDVMSSKKAKRQWTLVINDVDRHHPNPALADWMDVTFGFLSRWRRDDAQISLASTDGGIGPHVDNYDVFLIQSSGQRKWLVGTDSKMTAAEEQSNLIPNIPVSILRLEKDNDTGKRFSTELHLETGDMLYLPPRFLHWGTATSDDCMTLSVGCRAPGAADLVSHIAEHLQTSVRPKAVQRYTDSKAPTDDKDDIPSLSEATKTSMKELVREAIDELLQDDKAFDELVGKLTTKSMRYTDDTARSYSETSLQHRDYWGDTPSILMARVMKLGNLAVLRRTPGISFATSRVETVLGSVDRLYFDGNMLEIVNDTYAKEIFRLIERGDPLNGKLLKNQASERVLLILEELVNNGFIQAHRHESFPDTGCIDDRDRNKEASY